ncbi:hypothetical protein AGMMS50239_20970 [Bacteroidia bacterium]|nr:hypothetical protein AGMMS50239_20970 [Bacteroidia bacterium]
MLKKFSIDTLNDTDYFISLLFYMGLLTIKEPVMNKVRLGILNYSIRTLYWEYIMKLVREQSPEMTIETRYLDEAITALAMEGDLSSPLRVNGMPALAINLTPFRKKTGGCSGIMAGMNPSNGLD